MKVSDLKPNNHTMVATPNNDSYRCLINETQLDKFIAEFGDVEIVVSSGPHRFDVPAFEAGRQKYSALKAADCRLYGCN